MGSNPPWLRYLQPPAPVFSKPWLFDFCPNWRITYIFSCETWSFNVGNDDQANDQPPVFLGPIWQTHVATTFDAFVHLFHCIPCILCHPPIWKNIVFTAVTYIILSSLVDGDPLISGAFDPPETLDIGEMWSEETSCWESDKHQKAPQSSQKIIMDDSNPSTRPIFFNN